jgi:iron complex outermembrane receptor protein
MSHKKVALFGAAATLAIFAAQSGVSFAQTAAGPSVSEVIVTAQKRQENIQNVGMSIQAASGDKLTKLGVTDTASLQKIVPGFVFTPTYYGTLVYTIRGVGFQDTSLAGSPTVSAYLDEAPLPFSALTNGASLDLQRVEVLKGPQGTLFGNNATGGAINYIANKPTDTFHSGMDLTWGRFSDIDAKGYVSGPLTEGLDARIAVESHTSGAWQKGYGPQSGQSIGGKDFLNGRVALQWKPNDNFKALLTLSGWQDKSYNQMGQLYGLAELSPGSPLDPNMIAYPKAPHTPEAAGWNQCVNTSPYDPIAGQQYGALWMTPTGVYESQGPGSTVQAGGQPTHCVPPRNNNTYYSGTLRMDYDLGHDMTVTSLTEYQKFNRTAGIDGSGMPIQDYQSYQRGKITSTFQELRLAGKFNGKGSWIIGANYEYDNTWDSFLQTYNASTASPTLFSNNTALYSYLSQGSSADFYNLLGNGASAPFPGIYSADFSLFGFSLGPTKPSNLQKTTTYAVYANAEYPILENLTLQAGVRFTQEDKRGEVCGDDGGDGSWSLIAYNLQQTFLKGAYYEQNNITNPDPAQQQAAGAYALAHARLSPPGTCATVGYPQNNYNSPAGGALIASDLNQNNVSWRVGLNWKVAPGNLLYFNVSKGYKGGSYPTVAMSTWTQAHPVVQEGLLAYEGGFKSTLFDKQLTINGAGFYYDYTDKQILGAIPDVLFGALPALVNVPQSHVIGFELSGVYTPEWLKGLTITPSVSYQHTNIDTSNKSKCSAIIVATLAAEGAPACVPGHFYNYDAFYQLADFTNEKFPSAPEWQASVDAEYDWQLRDDITAFVGVNVQYTSSTSTFFLNRTPIQPVGGYNEYGVTTGSPIDSYNHPNDPASVKAYTLVDLRAGIQKGDWRLQVWGHNVTNEYYWTGAEHVNDVLLRYTGMPTTYGITVSWKH